jgi:hypothetical protein
LARCAHGRNSETAWLNFSTKVRRGRFQAEGLIGNRHSPDAALHLRGRLAGGHARGSMRVFGDAVPVDDTDHGKTDRCDSGKVRWTARRR